ncbi:hypothetical protein SAM9427_36855 (plasmid) [Streptomyces sp. ETH9427]|uniref:hypothetical protein n=1 Tax=Streptomyces sp. E1N211 TaxID=1851876 RepID=UPI000E0AB82A|nr:hypothetical protein [Streptomyces sp. E1N211]AXI91339.1 hypothetical protein SAM9427_36855 [Streptomyces sp. ETH9427]
MGFRISEKDVDKYPGLRERLEQARAGTRAAPAARQKPKAASGGGSAYVECDVAAEAAGARHWLLELPAIELINANEVRGWHWRKERRVAARIREAAAVVARQAKVPRLERARVLYLVHPTSRTRVFDPSNWALSAKAAVDGLSDAGIWEDDNAAVVTGVDPRAGARQNGARVRLSLVVIDQGAPPAAVL